MVTVMGKLTVWKHLSVATSLLLVLGLFALAGSLGCPGPQPDHQVTIPDPGLEAAIRDALNMPGGPIYASQLRAFPGIDCRGRGIRNLSGIEYLTNATWVWAGQNQISDISPLAGLSGLWSLSLSGNQISNLAPLANLTKLTGLGLEQNQITDVSPLADLSSLEDLYLAGNQITDVSPLAGLTKLTGLGRLPFTPLLISNYRASP